MSMRLSCAGSPHLTYCTNIHAGERWGEIRDNLERHVAAVKRAVAPDAPFGVGLRLSAVAAEALDDPRELDGLRALLDAHGLYVFTINGFPYGPFHGTRVKEDVYLPDWMADERLVYTDRLARLLAALLPEGLEGTVSTVPGAFRARVTSAADAARMATMMLRHAAALWRLREDTGRTVSLALEPEPCCHVETVAEAVRFFEDHLFSSGAVAQLASLTGLTPAASEAAIRRHLGLCFDACHMAVEFEDVRPALAALNGAGIRIGKVQISAGLEVDLDGGAGDTDRLDALGPFAEGVYLHQVVEARDGGLYRWVDLPAALAVARATPVPRRWRIHFHVPLFREQLGPFRNTQSYLRELLAVVREAPVAPHLEVETYTWDVLPAAYRNEPIVDAVARELRWVLDRLRP